MQVARTPVFVHWIDAYDSSNGWIQVKEYKPQPCHVYQVGYIIEGLLDGHLSLTGSWCPEPDGDVDDIGMVTHIPDGMVQKVVQLGVPPWGAVYPASGGFDAT